MSGYVTVLTTTASADEADRLAEALVGEQLAACVQTTTIRSCYRWKGEVQREAEQLLLIKTREELFEPVRARIRELHSYATPQIVVLPIAAGDGDYLEWIAENTRGG